jgi:hypothetical protein
MLEGVVGLQNHYAELTGNEDGDKDAFLVPRRRFAFPFPN